MTLSRLTRLSGIIIENGSGEFAEEDDAFMASLGREKHVEQMIRFAFSKIGLTINYDNHSVSYEDSTREASVELEASQVSLHDLIRLQETGLSTDYQITHGSDSLRIEFVVSSEIDSAQLPVA